MTSEQRRILKEIYLEIKKRISIRTFNEFSKKYENLAIVNELESLLK